MRTEIAYAIVKSDKTQVAKMEKQPKNNPDRLSREELQTILHAPTPLHELAGITDSKQSDAIISGYSQSIIDALKTANPDATQSDTDNSLQARFIQVAETVKDLPLKGGSDPVIPYTPKDVVGAYGSKIAAHFPNPADFIKAMQPKPGQAVNGAAMDRLNTLAQAMYGERFAVYQQVATGGATEAAKRISNEQLVRNKAEDLEILGRSHGIKRIASDTTRRTMNFFAKTWANTRNVITSPKLFVREVAYNSAKHKHERLVAKVNPNSSSILNRYRQKKADKQEQKVVTRLERRNVVKDKMDARTDAAQHLAETNNLRHQEKVNQYKERKQAAVAHKELRKSLRAEGASRREARAILAEIAPEQLQRIGKVACLYNGALRIEKQLEARSAYAESHKTYLEESLSAATETERSLNRLSERLDLDAYEIYEQTLPNLVGQIEAKQQLLASYDADTPDYASTQHDISTLQQEEQKMKQEMEHKQRRAKEAQEQAKSARRRQEQLRAKIAAQKKRVIEQQQRLRKQQALSDERYQRKREAINGVLNKNNANSKGGL